MKRYLFVLCAYLICFIDVQAQSLTEVVYLKNDSINSIIRGSIIEVVPDKSIKIRTSDDYVFAYPMSDVLKIVKEPVDNVYSNSSAKLNTLRTEFKNNYIIQAGYKGFAEFGGGFGVGYWAGGFVSLTASYGYQFNPHIYIGVGIGFNYDFYNSLTFLPIFADCRWNVFNKHKTPVLGVRIGYSVYDGQGVFFNPSIGYRWGLTESVALNVTFNYGLQDDSVYCWGILHTLGFKLGVEF